MAYIHIATMGTLRNPIGRAARRRMVIGVGFGFAALCRDGKPVVYGDKPPKGYRDKDGWFRLDHAEKYASRRGRAVWEVRMDAPLWSATCRRVRPGKWVVIEAGEGFA